MQTMAIRRIYNDLVVLKNTGLGAGKALMVYTLAAA